MKRIFIVAGFIILAVFGLLNCEGQKTQPELSASFVTPEAKKPPKKAKKMSPAVKDGTPIKAVSEDTWVWETKSYEDDWCHIDELDAEGMAKADKIIREHLYKQGYFFANAIMDPVVVSDLIAVDFEDYRGYDKETLTDLGKEGDLRALTALFDKKDATDDEKYWAGYTAAIYGGTYLPDMLGNKLIADAFVETLNTKFLADNKSKYIDGLAWSYFSAMRGDLIGWQQTMIDFEKFGRVHFPTGTLENEDMERVRQKAQEYYQAIIAEREKRNLGAFDKLPPNVATVLTSEMLAEDVAMGNSDLWPEEFIPKDNKCFNRVVAWIENKIENEPLQP